ncbi:MAG: class I SAM-dependent methyltransferase [Candidatus Xenobia bacterium]
MQVMFHPDGPSFWELAVQALSSTERGYDLLASKFDYTPFRTPQRMLDAASWHFPDVDDALDLCCGTGAALEMLRPRCRRRLVGVDFSAGMLQVATRRLAGCAQLELLRSDVLALPFEQSFDLVTSWGSFGHILPRDEPRFIAGIHRMLRPGGCFIFATTPVPPIWTRAWWLSRAFNAVMHVRNWLVKPEFIMYYLTFTVPGVVRLLERQGFSVVVRDNVFPAPLSYFRLIIATRV